MGSDEVDVLSSFARKRRIHFALRVAWFAASLICLLAPDLDRETRLTIFGSVVVVLLAIHYATWACPRCVKSFGFFGENIRFCPHCGVILRGSGRAAVAPRP